MTVFNVRTTIVELIEADDADAAIAEMHRRLHAAGFEPYTDDSCLPDAFESEEQP